MPFSYSSLINTQVIILKIGIITFHAPLNYGAVLQAYALSKYLESLGHEPCIIQYCPNKDLEGLFVPRYGVFGLHPADYINLYRQRAFGSFRRNYLSQTDQIFYRSEQLKELEPFDAYICGSDQIWNPELTGGELDPAFFLSFAKNDVPRISYAASSGGYDIGKIGSARDFLRNLTHISVREKELVGPVGELSGKPVVNVLDPTLLPVSYLDLIEEKRAPGYILLYCLQESRWMYEQVRNLSKLTGLPILNLGSKVNPWKHPGRQRCSSPEGFVTLFKNADYVVTNSFHGTVFSIIFERPFFTMALVGDRADRNVRMIDLLNATGLSYCLKGEGYDMGKHDVEFANNIDWGKTALLLNALRERSTAFLAECLCS